MTGIILFFYFKKKLLKTKKVLIRSSSWLRQERDAETRRLVIFNEKHDEKDFSTFFIQENKVLTAFIWDKTTSKPCGHKSAYLHKISVGLEHKGTSLNFYLNWSLRQQKDHWWHPRCGPALFHSTLPPTAQASCTLKLIFLHAEPKVCVLWPRAVGWTQESIRDAQMRFSLMRKTGGPNCPEEGEYIRGPLLPVDGRGRLIVSTKLERWISQTEQQTENVQETTWTFSKRTIKYTPFPLHTNETLDKL